ncbi:MAG TPA: hypothetical protein DCQ92_10360 [Verrucomicrobia subdivision 3 bacterium]|nr:hypothetical protein [Limisphaerales bacterium]
MKNPLDFSSDVTSDFIKQVKQSKGIGNEDKIRANAERFTMAALLLFILGSIVMVVSILFLFSGNEAIAGLIIAGSLISTAFWSYLIAQIIHIRANTHK